MEEFQNFRTMLENFACHKLGADYTLVTMDFGREKVVVVSAEVVEIAVVYLAVVSEVGHP